MSEYEQIGDDFRSLTNVRHPMSKRCCEVVVNGVPWCCQQVIDGADVTFTAKEISLAGLSVGLQRREDGMFVLDRQIWCPEAIADALHNGWLSLTLESASHPTRPMLRGPLVTGVVVIDDCNGIVGLEHYRAHRNRLQDLWQRAVNLTGLKPYYVTYGMRDGWVLL